MLCARVELAQKRKLKLIFVFHSELEIKNNYASQISPDLKSGGGWFKPSPRYHLIPLLSSKSP